MKLSWEFSIYNAVKEIQQVNRRRKARGNYANETELLVDGFETAIRKAALEAFGGQYSDQELRAMVDPEQVQAQALELIAG